MSQPLFERVDLSAYRRVFTAGDIHGCFDLLSSRLEELDFHPGKDMLILLGDLVDRGPFNEAALDWCQKPGVMRIRGNHDQLLNRAVVGPDENLLLHMRNGGSWFMSITDEAERQRWADTIIDCPIALEVITPAGRRVGFVHADVPTNTWEELEPALAASRRTLDASDYLDRESVAWKCMWQRDRIDNIKQLTRAFGSELDHDCSVPGIDHVFFGHSIVMEPVTHGNCSWIDTGAFKRDILTVVDVDAWLDNLVA